MSALLLTECFEGHVLEAGHFGLEEAELHESGSRPVVVLLHLLHFGAGDVEEGQPPPVGSADLDPHELAAPGEPERREEEVFRLEHPPPPGFATPVDAARGARVRWAPNRGEPDSP